MEDLVRRRTAACALSLALTAGLFVVDGATSQRAAIATSAPTVPASISKKVAAAAKARLAPKHYAAIPAEYIADQYRSAAEDAPHAVGASDVHVGTVASAPSSARVIVPVLSDRDGGVHGSALVKQKNGRWKQVQQRLLGAEVSVDETMAIAVDARQDPDSADVAKGEYTKSVSRGGIRMTVKSLWDGVKLRGLQVVGLDRGAQQMPKDFDWKDTRGFWHSRTGAVDKKTDITKRARSLLDSADAAFLSGAHVALADGGVHEFEHASFFVDSSSGTSFYGTSLPNKSKSKKFEHATVLKTVDPDGYRRVDLYRKQAGSWQKVDEQHLPSTAWAAANYVAAQKRLVERGAVVDRPGFGSPYQVLSGKFAGLKLELVVEVKRNGKKVPLWMTVVP